MKLIYVCSIWVHEVSGFQPGGSVCLNAQGQESPSSACLYAVISRANQNQPPLVRAVVATDTSRHTGAALLHATAAPLLIFRLVPFLARSHGKQGRHCQVARHEAVQEQEPDQLQKGHVPVWKPIVGSLSPRPSQRGHHKKRMRCRSDPMQIFPAFFQARNRYADCGTQIDSGKLLMRRKREKFPLQA